MTTKEVEKLARRQGYKIISCDEERIAMTKDKSKVVLDFYAPKWRYFKGSLYNRNKTLVGSGRTLKDVAELAGLVELPKFNLLKVSRP